MPTARYSLKWLLIAVSLSGVALGVLGNCARNVREAHRVGRKLETDGYTVRSWGDLSLFGVHLEATGPGPMSDATAHALCDALWVTSVTVPWKGHSVTADRILCGGFHRVGVVGLPKWAYRRRYLTSSPP